MIKGFLFDALYIPESYFTVEHRRALAKRFARRIYEDKNCEACEYFQDRFSFMCSECPAYVGRFKLYKTQRIKGTKYIGLPRGVQNEALKMFGLREGRNLRIIDRRPRPKLPKGLAITSTLFPHQVEAITMLLKHHKFDEDKGTYVPTVKGASYNGILKAPPRTGKTLIVLALAVAFGYRTIIIAHQGDLLNQFIEDIEEHTNFKDVASFSGEQVYGIAKKVEDFGRFPITLVTYQQFISDAGQKKLMKIRKLYGTLAVDEGHRSAAKCYSSSLSKFPAVHRIAVSGTPDRKDGLDFITKDLIGPVRSWVEAESLTPTVHIHETKAKPKYEYKTWIHGIKWLADNEERAQLIIRYIMRDLKNGHSVVVPVFFVLQSTYFADQINKKWRRLGNDEDIAVAFHGKSNREDILEGARSGRYRVVIGIRSIISTGINVPRWSAMYTISPISNAPNYEQETRRVCTKMEGKKTPIIRMFVDDMGLAVGCFRTCYYRTYFPLKFNIPQKAKDKADRILKNVKKDRGLDDRPTRSDHDKPIRKGGLF